MRRLTDLADPTVAAVVGAVTLLTTAAGPSGGRLDAVALVCAAVACAPLAVRRRFPVWVLLVSAVGAEAYLLCFLGRHGSFVLAAPLIALFTVAEAGTRKRSLGLGVLAVLAFAGVHILIKPGSWLGAENIALAALGGLAVAAGDAARNRRAYLTEVEDRARQAETDREAEAARRVTEERLRIARDLHDVVGHQLALIRVQAEVAAHLLDTSPAGTREALAHVRDASRGALRELGETVALLRRPDESATPVEPVAGLSGVDDLLAAFRRAGLVITDHVDESTGPVPVAAELTAYRILQESLTNVRKHAGPTAVDVRLTYRPDRLRIVVDNTATSAIPASDGHGHGLVGMRERVTALGGDLQAGPRPDGGYRVTAELPL
jgi:signal transduction histidine kinase